MFVDRDDYLINLTRFDLVVQKVFPAEDEIDVIVYRVQINPLRKRAVIVIGKQQVDSVLRIFIVRENHGKRFVSVDEELCMIGKETAVARFDARLTPFERSYLRRLDEARRGVEVGFAGHHSRNLRGLFIRIFRSIVGLLGRCVRRFGGRNGLVEQIVYLLARVSAMVVSGIVLCHDSILFQLHCDRGFP